MAKSDSNTFRDAQEIGWLCAAVCALRRAKEGNKLDANGRR